MGLDQSTSSANEARPSKSSLVEVFSIQGVRVCVVRPMVIKLSDYRVARDEAYRFREIEDMPNRFRSVVSPIFKGFCKCLIGVMSCSMAMTISQLCADRLQWHAVETPWAPRSKKGEPDHNYSSPFYSCNEAIVYVLSFGSRRSFAQIPRNPETGFSNTAHPKSDPKGV